MTSLLRIDASSRQQDSHSRSLGDYFQKRWLEKYPEKNGWLSAKRKSNLVYRDLLSPPIGHIAQSTITGFYTPPEAMTSDLSAATALSDQLIDELQKADTLLITTPIYNFSVPSSLKAWIDQIVRIGHTFSFDGQSFGGLVKVRQACVICAYGASGYLEGGDFRGANFLELYLAFILDFLGIKDVRFISAESLTGDEATVQTALEKARTDIDQLFL
ncbi:MAG: FMN-dependent NADH-azoreductase [Methyloligellaceae bacterium]